MFFIKWSIIPLFKHSNPKREILNIHLKKYFWSATSFILLFIHLDFPCSLYYEFIEQVFFWNQAARQLLSSELNIQWKRRNHLFMWHWIDRILHLCPHCYHQIFWCSCKFSSQSGYQGRIIYPISVCVIIWLIWKIPENS